MKKYLVIFAAIGIFAVTLNPASAQMADGDVYKCVELNGHLYCEKV